MNNAREWKYFIAPLTLILLSPLSAGKNTAITIENGTAIYTSVAIAAGSRTLQRGRKFETVIGTHRCL